MVLPAQFQLGLELTNIVNPISQAVSALGSLALIDAIKKSGSDFITETKLASFIGRHRIDPVIKFHFREMVAKSDQSVISRYMDIILESGSGPTVQEALKNPALFSMVIQLSGLAFAHQDESLANAIVEAIEKIVQESNGDVGIVPDYVSLLGTIQACQQQTAAFRWALLYEAAEEKIHRALASSGSRSSKRRKKKYSINAQRKFDQPRSLPLPVLQGLLMWLQSLQSFPEHRLLHLRCDTGFSTVVVWCHHILGLSLTIDIQGTEICFGDAPYNLVVEEIHSQKAGVTLMDPLDPQEPLFTLQNDQHGMGISYERRAEAYGYGLKFLGQEGVPGELMQRVAKRVIPQIIEHIHTTYASDTIIPMDSHDINRRSPTEKELLSAVRFLFVLDEDTTFSSLKSIDEPPDFVELPLHSIHSIAAIVIAFARIPEDDLEGCRVMPLALGTSSSLLDGEPVDFLRTSPESALDLSQSFQILVSLLLGHHMRHNDYVAPAVLVSAWGWSVFYDSMDSVDPLDVPVDKLRILPGVPSRRGLRRTRIIDGPPSRSLPGKSLGLSEFVRVLEGVSTTRRGATLVGHQSDAFQVTQQFTHANKTLTSAYGLRELIDRSIRSLRLPPCKCDKSTYGRSQGESKPLTTSAHKMTAIKEIFEDPRQKGSLEGIFFSDNGMESVFSSQHRKKHYVYVSDNPAARWLQLQVLYLGIDIRKPKIAAGDCYVALGGPDTCISCAIRISESWPSAGVILL